MPKYLLYLSQSHTGFRRAELESLADLHHIDVDLSHHNPSSPFLIVSLKNDTEARDLVSRSVLCRGIYEYWGQGANEEELHEDIKRNSDGGKKWREYDGKSFKFDFIGYLGSREQRDQIRVIEQFAYLQFDGKIRLKNPDEVFTVLEEFVEEGSNCNSSVSSSIENIASGEEEKTEAAVKEKVGGKVVKSYFGRLVGITARERNVLDKYNLRKRKYVGTTSFDAELSLVSVNIAQVDAFKIMYDPFVGTGSFLVAAAEFGAITMGSDIDIKTLIGKEVKHKHKNKPQNKIKNRTRRKLQLHEELKDVSIEDNIKGNDVEQEEQSKTTTTIRLNIESNFKQYNTSHSYLEVLTMDFTHSALRPNMTIDTICCDPPYGVREGLKVLGASEARSLHFEGKEHIEIDGVKAFLRKDYVPPKRPYQLGNMLDDLLAFAAARLPSGGRLVFWMPVANDEDYVTVVPHHARLELRYNCVQKFNRWSRRLLCYVKRLDSDKDGKVVKAGEVLKNEFRQRYFSGFEELTD